MSSPPVADDAAPDFEATDKQVELMQTILAGKASIIGFGGGIRGTKTWGVLGVFMTLGRLFPGSRWAVVRKDLERMRQNTWPSFEKLRALTGSFWGRMNGQSYESVAANGSVILFRGENIDRDPDLSRWKGWEANGIALEEADEMSEASLWKSVERAGAWIIPQRKGVPVVQPPPIVLVTFNPNESWPAEYFYRPWLDGSIKPPFAYVPATILDNPYAPEAYQENLKNLPDAHYKRFVAADWESMTGRFYSQVNKAHLIDRSQLPEKLPDWWTYWGSFDWGYDHWAVFGEWCKTGDGQIILLDSHWQRKEHDDKLASNLRLVAHPKTLREVYAGWDCWSKYEAHQKVGNLAESTAEVFEKYGITLTRADIDLVGGARAVRSALSIRDGRPGVLIVNTENNERVYRQLLATKPDPKNIRKPLKVDAVDGKGGDDGESMFRYGLASVVPVPTYDEEQAERLAERAKLVQLGDNLSVEESRAWETVERKMSAEERAKDAIRRRVEFLKRRRDRQS